MQFLNRERGLISVCFYRRLSARIGGWRKFSQIPSSATRIPSDVNCCRPTPVPPIRTLPPPATRQQIGFVSSICSPLPPEHRQPLTIAPPIQTLASPTPRNQIGFVPSISSPNPPKPLDSC